VSAKLGLMQKAACCLLALGALLASCRDFQVDPHWPGIDGSGGIDAGSRYPAAVLLDHPVAYWRLGEPPGSMFALDQVGSSAGTYVNGPSLGEPGALVGDPDTAMTLNGTDQYVHGVISDRFSPLATGNTMSVEAWVLLHANPPSPSYVVSKGDPNNWEWGMGVQEGGLPFCIVWDPGGGLILEWLSSTRIQLALWHHLVTVVDKAASMPVIIYLDGFPTQGNLSTGPGQEESGNAPLEIGRRATTTTYWPGSIDEVAFYSTALSMAQVQAHLDAAR
jgi:large repetitive protein